MALAAGLARPATTSAITTPGGQPLPGAVAELTTVDLGGHELGLVIRGASTDNPVILFLAGGPGGSELEAMRRRPPALEEHFTVVTWDQRGAGTSYDELDPAHTVTLDGSVADTIALTNYLRDRFHTEAIYLLGQSWGTTLGVLAVQEQPQLYRAFVGTGQMGSSRRATDQLFDDDTLAWATRPGDNGLVEQLKDAGPRPAPRCSRTRPPCRTRAAPTPTTTAATPKVPARCQRTFSSRSTASSTRSTSSAPSWTPFAALYPQPQDIDFRRTATDFEIHVLRAGAHEARGRAQLFEQWYPLVKRPDQGRRRARNLIIPTRPAELVSDLGQLHRCTDSPERLRRRPRPPRGVRLQPRRRPWSRGAGCCGWAEWCSAGRRCVVDVVEAARTRAGRRAKPARGAWTALTLSGAAAFWTANLLISLTPTAAAYRSAQSIEYVPMLVEAAVGGLVIAGLVSLIMLRLGARLPGSGRLHQSLFLAACALVLVTVVVEVPAKLGAGDPGRWLLVATIINIIRILALGLSIGLLARARDAGAERDSPGATKEDKR